MFTLLGLTIMVMLTNLINLTVSNAFRDELLVSMLGESGTDLLRLHTSLVMLQFVSYFNKLFITFVLIICLISHHIVGLVRQFRDLIPEDNYL